MKRTAMILAAVLALVMVLSACDRNVGTSDASNVSTPVAAMVKTGLATVNTLAVSDDAMTVKTVAAAVAVGDGGKITACRLDELETDAKLHEGKISREKNVRSKYEQGYDYGLAASKPAKKEWFEQVDALCDYVVGMTAAEVAEIRLDNGVASDETLRSKCTLVITPFLEAIGKACATAADRGAQAGDRLSLSLSADDRSGGSDKVVQNDVQIAAVTLNSHSVVTDCIVDVAGKTVEVVDGAFSGETGDFRSGKDKKSGPDDTSDTVSDAEWATSARAFEEYVVGKTSTQVKATPLTDGKPSADTDLAKKCSIRVTEMLNNTLKAIAEANASKETVENRATATDDTLLEDAESMVRDAVSRVDEMLTESR